MTRVLRRGILCSQISLTFLCFADNNLCKDEDEDLHRILQYA